MFTAISDLQEARAQNERKRQRDSPAALEARMAKTQSLPAKPRAPTVQELSPAEGLKEQGNTALKQGKLQLVSMHVIKQPAGQTVLLKPFQ